MSRYTACLTALVLLATACAIPGRPSKIDTPPGTAPARPISLSLPTAVDMQYMATYEIRFRGKLSGYLLEVLEVPEGVQDLRAYPPGTSLIQDTELTFIGFISPGGTTYRFNDVGEASAVGFGSRNSSIASFFRKYDEPTLVSIHPGAALNG